MWNRYKYTALPLGLDGSPLSQSAKSVDSDTWLVRICHFAITSLSFLILIITLPVSIWCFLKIVPDYERAVVFRLGRVRPARGPGLVLLLPLIDQFQRVDLRTRSFTIQPCKVKSRDDALLSLGADVQFRVCDPVLSVLSVQDLNFVIQHTAENLLAQSLGRKYLREIHGDRLRIAEHLKEDINEQVKPWGVFVEHVHLLMEAVLRSHEENVSVPLTPQAVTPNSGLEQLILQYVSMVNQSTPECATSSEAFKELSLQQMLSLLEGTMSASLVSEVGCSYQIYVTLQGGERAAYMIDLKSGSGHCGWGVLPSPADVTLEISEDDLLSIIKRDLNPMTAYATGRLRIAGNLQTALQLEKVLRLIMKT